MALDVPDDSGSTGGFDMTGPSVADYYSMDYSSAQPSAADYYQLDSQGYNDAPQPYYGKANDEVINAMRSARNDLEAYRKRLHYS